MQNKIYEGGRENLHHHQPPFALIFEGNLAPLLFSLQLAALPFQFSQYFGEASLSFSELIECCWRS